MSPMPPSNGLFDAMLFPNTASAAADAVPLHKTSHAEGAAQVLKATDKVEVRPLQPCRFVYCTT